MNEAFNDLPFVKIYIDDLIIASKCVEDHFKHIEKVLERCMERSISLRKDKCHFLKSHLKVLGYFISKDGITQDAEKLEAIKNFWHP